MISKSAVAVVTGFMLLLAGVLTAQKRTPPAPEEKHLSDSFKGSELFKAYCATCHGKDGKGGGPMAASLKASPADLTKISARSGGVFPFVKVQQVIAGEAQPTGSHGSREMPVWGPIFSEVSWDQDLGRVRVYALAMYLEEIQAK